MDCGFSCHEGCAYSNYSDKQNCCAMVNGYCIQCPKKCHWERHQNMSYIWKVNTVVKQVTNHEMLDKYNISVNDKDAKEKLLLKQF